MGKICNMKTVNIRELAKELNLAISTVSKALKDSYEISPETKDRVLKLAEKLNYTPNPYASSLRRKKSNTIAVVIPEVADSFFSLAIKGIEEIAQTKGYHVLIYLTYESYIKERKILEEFRNGRVDGVLMSVSSETVSAAHINGLCEAEMPLVFFDRAMGSIEAARVRTDDFHSGYLATTHLIQQGCRRVAYLSISTQLEIVNDRLGGYKKALIENELPFDEKWVIACSNDFADNYQMLANIMKQQIKPDGIIASVEKLITPFYVVCNDLKINIPSAVKVVAFANLPTAQILYPSLTTITQPALEMGKAAATLLFKALEKRSYNLRKEDLVIPSQLLVRDSSVHT